MCFNFHASMAAFAIGEVTGALLTSSPLPFRTFGICVMFITLVQLIEALVYKYGSTPLLAWLLNANLGSQGLLFFALAQPWGLYFWICLLISVYFIVKTPKLITLPKLKWNLSSFDTWILTIMYTLVFLFSLTTPAYRILAVVILAMYVLSLGFSYFLNKYRPSLWCLFSAVGSPLLLYAK